MNSGRCKRKNVPRQPGEPTSVPVKTLKRKIKSRRFETKVMFLAVIGWPCMIFGKWFNGLVGIYEVAKTREALKSSSTTLFCYHNEDQKEVNDKWRDVCNETMQLSALQAAIDENFNLDVDKTKLQFRTRMGVTAKNPKGKFLYLNPGSSIQSTSQKNLKDWELVVHRKKGETFTEVS